MLIAANNHNAFCVLKWTPGMGLFSSLHRGQQLSNDHDFWPEKISDFWTEKASMENSGGRVKKSI